ncbi:MAG TPA: lysophospholipid acyltransferase family protein [Bacteroidales bacterium]|nr:lysophospholipid acyltransferase family protein [Bacteroidales bacterium]
MNFIAYLLFRLLVFIFRLLPFRVLYMLSDVLYILIYHIAKYRKKTVISNLKRSFPAKTGTEINTIAKQFYHFLADITLESIKGFSMTPKQVKARHKVNNPEMIDDLYNNHQSVIMVSGHYGNWEWGSLSGGLQLKHSMAVFYKPVKNKFIDNYLREKRATFFSELIPLPKTYKAFEKHTEKPYVYIMVADQSPSKLVKSYWVDFLNQDTACIHGPEMYARKFGIPVYYFDIQRVKRGFYEVNFVEIAIDPQSLSEGEVTARFMKVLERKINEKPQYWLWSHKRWKRTRADIQQKQLRHITNLA